MKHNLKKNDTVKILSGKDRGKKGKVLRVDYGKTKLVVEGINIVKRHQKPTQKFQGGIIEKPAAIYISKVQLICPKCGEPTRVGRREGKRVCQSCEEVIDKV